MTIYHVIMLLTE